jgi:hypothetical protein
MQTDNLFVSTRCDLFVSAKLIMREMALETPLGTNTDIITIISKYIWSHAMICCVVLPLRLRKGCSLLGYSWNNIHFSSTQMHVTLGGSNKPSPSAPIQHTFMLLLIKQHVLGGFLIPFQLSFGSWLYYEMHSNKM